jgi:hypothetical protein
MIRGWDTGHANMMRLDQVQVLRMIGLYEVTWKKREVKNKSRLCNTAGKTLMFKITKGA